MTGALGTDRKMRHPYLLGAPRAVRFIRQGLRWRQRLSEQRELNADRPAPVVLEMGGQIPPLASESRMGGVIVGEREGPCVLGNPEALDGLAAKN